MRMVLRHARWSAAAAVLLTVALPRTSRVWGTVPQAQLVPADVLILHGHVYSADGSGIFHEAMAIRGTAIAAVGRAGDVERLRGPKTEIIDAAGGAVVPGFQDNHVHLLMGGLDLGNVDLQGAQPLAEMQARIRVFAQAHPERAWIEGAGWGSLNVFPGNQPTKDHLDAAVGDRPVFMRAANAHSAWVNSKALALAGITATTADPPNGVIVRDPSTRESTGWLKEGPAIALITDRMPQPTRADQRRALRAAIAEAQRVGITSITFAAGNANATYAAGNPETLDLLEDMRNAGELSMRVNYALIVRPGFSAQDADRYDAVWRSHPSTPQLRTGIAKMFLDGTGSGETAFMLPSPGRSSAAKAFWTPDEFDRVVQMLDRRGWQIMVHVNGDGAVRMGLDALERAAKVNPAPARGRRHRLEHVSNLDLADAPRFGTLGIIADVQRVTREWKRIAAAGGRVTFSSDWPVAPFNPLARVFNISIPTSPARAVGSDQLPPATTAIDLYTREPAYASFDERRTGSLAPGMLADVVVLANDIFSHRPTTDRDTVVNVTIFDGKVVYRMKSGR